MYESLPLNIDQSNLQQDIQHYGKLKSFTKGQMLFSPEEMLEIFFSCSPGGSKSLRSILKMPKSKH